MSTCSSVKRGKCFLDHEMVAFLVFVGNGRIRIGDLFFFLLERMKEKNVAGKLGLPTRTSPGNAGRPTTSSHSLERC